MPLRFCNLIAIKLIGRVYKPEIHSKSIVVFLQTSPITHPLIIFVKKTTSKTFKKGSKSKSTDEQVQARFDAMSKENPQVKLSPRERAIWKEWKYEMIIKKALPFSVITGALIVYWGFTKSGGNIRQTIIKTVPAMMARDAFVGFALEKHFMPKCEDKFLTLEPHGEIAKCKSTFKIAKCRNLRIVLIFNL